MKEPSQKVANDRNIKWGWDIPILMLVQMSNYEHAVSNENKFLLRDSLHGFPIMNYVLGEGPYKPPWDSVFGGDDFHCILRADDGNLIYFLPEIHGLELGHYVEVLIGE